MPIMSRMTSKSTQAISTDLTRPNDNVIDVDVPTLHYEPQIIRGRQGERFWLAVDNEDCIRWLTLQLKVFDLA